MSIQDMHERLKKANERRNCGADEEIARLRAELIDCLGRAANIARDNARLRAVNAELAGALSSPELLETLAALEHERWSGWMKYQAEKAGGKHPITGEPYEIRWKRQSETPYARLPEQERESDRVEVRKTLAVIRAAISRAEQANPETCVWAYSDHIWTSGCGNRSIHSVREGIYCPFCGRRIEVR